MSEQKLTEVKLNKDGNTGRLIAGIIGLLATAACFASYFAFSGHFQIFVLGAALAIITAFIIGSAFGSKTTYMAPTAKNQEKQTELNKENQKAFNKEQSKEIKKVNNEDEVLNKNNFTEVDKTKPIDNVQNKNLELNKANGNEHGLE